MGISGICSKCGESDIDYLSVFVEDDCVNAPYKCSNCGFYGIELYEMRYKETREEFYDFL